MKQTESPPKLGEELGMGIKKRVGQQCRHTLLEKVGTCLGALANFPVCIFAVVISSVTKSFLGKWALVREENR